MVEDPLSLKRMKSLNYLAMMEARRKRGEKRGWSRRRRGRKDRILVANLLEKERKKKQIFVSLNVEVKKKVEEKVMGIKRTHILFST